MNDERFRTLLANVMLYGVLLAVAVMLVGGIVYLSENADRRPGDHVFTGEPADLRHPVAIVRAAFAGNDTSVIQVGVLLLLLNPLLRVALAAAGYAASGDRLYAIISTVVFTVLVVSFFV